MRQDPDLYDKYSGFWGLIDIKHFVNLILMYAGTCPDNDDNKGIMVSETRLFFVFVAQYIRM